MVCAKTGEGWTWRSTLCSSRPRKAPRQPLAQEPEAKSLTPSPTFHLCPSASLWASLVLIQASAGQFEGKRSMAIRVRIRLQPAFHHPPPPPSAQRSSALRGGDRQALPRGACRQRGTRFALLLQTAHRLPRRRSQDTASSCTRRLTPRCAGQGAAPQDQLPDLTASGANQKHWAQSWSAS